MPLRILIISLACLPAFLGCSTMKRTDTARTGREQLLISNAVDQSLSKCDFSAFHGAKVFLEEKYLDGVVDKGYIASSIRHRLMLNGASLASKPEESDVVVEVRSGGVGTDNADSYIGIPGVVIPGMVTLPEVRMWEKSRQSALAKIGIVAYDTKSHEMLGAGGVTAAVSNDNNMFVMGLGPFESGSAKTELKRTTAQQNGQMKQELPTVVAFRDVRTSDGVRSSDEGSQVQQTSDQVISASPVK